MADSRRTHPTLASRIVGLQLRRNAEMDALLYLHPTSTPPYLAPASPSLPAPGVCPVKHRRCTGVVVTRASIWVDVS